MDAEFSATLISVNRELQIKVGGDDFSNPR